MNRSLIPWHVFLEAITGQEPGALDSWLARWGFTNDGVILISAEAASGAPSPDFNYRERTPSNGARLKIGMPAHEFLLLLKNNGSAPAEETAQLWFHTKEL